MAWFSTGGNIGFALAPLMVGAIVGAGSLGWTPALIVPALVGVAVTLPVLRAVGARQRSGGSASSPSRAHDDVRSFIRLTAAVIFRSIAFVGLGTFIALYVQQRLGGTITGTIALFLFYLVGVIGSVAGGKLANRWDRVHVSRWSYLLTAAAIAGVVWVPGPAVYLFVAAASAGLYVPFSLQVTLGQDYLPSRVGTASGITLGLTVSIGGLVSPLLGVIADRTSLQTALIPLIVMPLLTWLMFRTLKEPIVRVPHQDESQTSPAR